MTPHVDLLAELLLISCAIPANGYLLFYAFRPWWVTEQGQALMIKSAGNALLIDLGLSVIIFGEDYWLRPFVRAAAFLLFGAGLWKLFLALLRSDVDRRYPPARWIDRLRGRRKRGRATEDLPPTHTPG